MIEIILDGLVLIGLMYLFDRKNRNRDFLETAPVAVIMAIAGVLTSRFLTPAIGLFALLPYLGLCIFLVWKLPEIAIVRAVWIACAFVAFKIVEPYLIRALLGANPA